MEADGVGHEVAHDAFAVSLDILSDIYDRKKGELTR